MLSALRAKHKAGVLIATMVTSLLKASFLFSSVYVNEESSSNTNVKYGVPQCSVLGPVLFTLYRLPLGSTIRKLCIDFHCYAHVMWLYSSMKPHDTPVSVLVLGCLPSVLCSVFIEIPLLCLHMILILSYKFSKFCFGHDYYM